MSLNILRSIATNINKSEFYRIMCDESTDVSNREQLVICIRWVDDNLEPHEEFLGLYKIDNIQASTIVAAIKDSLVRLNFSFSKCRGQCYDGASNMRGAEGGVAKLLCKEESRAVYMHCYGHALNLAVGDTIKESKNNERCA